MRGIGFAALLRHALVRQPVKVVERLNKLPTSLCVNCDPGRLTHRMGVEDREEVDGGVADET